MYTRPGWERSSHPAAGQLEEWRSAGAVAWAEYPSKRARQFHSAREAGYLIHYKPESAKEAESKNASLIVHIRCFGIHNIAAGIVIHVTGEFVHVFLNNFGRAEFNEEG